MLKIFLYILFSSSTFDLFFWLVSFCIFCCPKTPNRTQRMRSKAFFQRQSLRRIVTDFSCKKKKKKKCTEQTAISLFAISKLEQTELDKIWYFKHQLFKKSQTHQVLLFQGFCRTLTRTTILTSMNLHFRCS